MIDSLHLGFLFNAPRIARKPRGPRQEGINRSYPSLDVHTWLPWGRYPWDRNLRVLRTQNRYRRWLHTSKYLSDLLSSFSDLYLGGRRWGKAALARGAGALGASALVSGGG